MNLIMYKGKNDKKLPPSSLLPGSAPSGSRPKKAKGRRGQKNRKPLRGPGIAELERRRQALDTIAPQQVVGSSSLLAFLPISTGKEEKLESSNTKNNDELDMTMGCTSTNSTSITSPQKPSAAATTTGFDDSYPLVSI